MLTDMVSEPYEEVEPYNDVQPVMVFGALAPLVVTRLMEEFPSQFFSVSLGERVGLTGLLGGRCVW